MSQGIVCLQIGEKELRNRVLDVKGLRKPAALSQGRGRFSAASRVPVTQPATRGGNIAGVLIIRDDLKEANTNMN